MKIVVGLGNPGKQYELTRHNLGFMVLDALKNTPFHLSSKWQAELSTYQEKPEKILLVKPQTYMNNSGNIVKQLVSFYKLDPQRDLIVTYDDIDLPFGEIRLRLQGRAAGHRGMQSIINSVQTTKIPRLRLGISNQMLANYSASDFVLSTFTKEEQKKAVPLVLKKSCQALIFALKYDFVSAMNKYNS